MECKTCGALTEKNMYCSPACRYKYRDVKMKDIKNERRKALRLSRKKEKECAFCKKFFMPSLYLKKFCSPLCFVNNRKMREIKRINNLSEEEFADRKKAMVEYQKKYDSSLKGKTKSLRGHERRRNIKNEALKEETLVLVDARDIRCVYCRCEFEDEGVSKKTRDHFNHDLPFSEDNCVNACMSCNSSKGNIPIEKIPDWLEKKGFVPSKFVREKLE